MKSKIKPKYDVGQVVWYFPKIFRICGVAPVAARITEIGEALGDYTYTLKMIDTGLTNGVLGTKALFLSKAEIAEQLFQGNK